MPGGLRDSAVMCAVAQHHLLKTHGAQLHELLTEPLFVRGAAPEPLILTGRWLARGLFSTAHISPLGHIIPGFADMRETIELNPHLTPMGGAGVEDWRAGGSRSAQLLMPRRETLETAAVSAGQETAVALLSRFPNRVNLAPLGLVRAEDRPYVSALVQSNCQAALSELKLGVERLASWFPEHYGNLKSQPLQFASEDLLRRALVTALSTFRDTRMHTAHYQFERYGDEGPIGSLVERLAARTSQMALSDISKIVIANPCSRPRLAALKPVLRESLRALKEDCPSSAELWHSLANPERQSIIKAAARRAWKLAVQKQAGMN